MGIDKGLQGLTAFLTIEEFLDSPGRAYNYTYTALKDRWPEPYREIAEHHILESLFYTTCYIRDVIKDRWLEAEKILFRTCTIRNVYLRNFSLVDYPWISLTHLNYIL